MAFTLGRRIPGLASRVLGNGREISRTRFRHTRRRNGPDVPAPRMRDSPERGFQGYLRSALLGAQQHDHHQRPEDGQVPGQLHHAPAALRGRPSEARTGLQPDDHTLLHTPGPLPQHPRLLERGPAGGRKRSQEDNARLQGPMQNCSRPRRRQPVQGHGRKSGGCPRIWRIHSAHRT